MSEQNDRLDRLANLVDAFTAACRAITALDDEEIAGVFRGKRPKVVADNLRTKLKAACWCASYPEDWKAP